MYAGLVGDLVALTAPYTEASEVAIASQFLVAFGNAVGRGPHYYLGETRHGANEFAVVCGPTGTGRKGDAGQNALSPFSLVDREWCDATGPGLSSGEGLISCVRDATVKQVEKGPKAGEEVVVDRGVHDKRFLAVETEFSSVLKQFGRDGNILSNVLREAWDGRYVLRTRTRTSPLRATGAHVSLIGHTTAEDLRRYLSDLDVANGLANRIVYFYVERARVIANPRRAPKANRERLGERLRATLGVARAIAEVRFAPETERIFEEIYPVLSAHRPGLLGALLERAPAHVRRFSLIYALLEARDVIQPRHLESALALWDVAEASVRIIFHGRTGSETLDRILLELLPGETKTLEEIRRDIFAGHVSASRLRDALNLGLELGEIEIGQRSGEGRTAATVTRLAPRAQPGEAA